MRIYEVLFNENKRKTFDNKEDARKFCEQFYETCYRYSYEFDRYIEEIKPVNGGCCLIIKEVLL